MVCSLINHGSGLHTRILVNTLTSQIFSLVSYQGLILNFISFRGIRKGFCIFLDHGFLPTHCKGHCGQGSFWSIESCRIHCRCPSNLILMRGLVLHEWHLVESWSAWNRRPIWIYGRLWILWSFLSKQSWFIVDMQNIDYLPVVNAIHIGAWKFGVHELSWGCQCTDPADRLLWTQTSLNRIKDGPGPDPLQPQSGLSYWYQCQSPGAVPSEMVWPLKRMGWLKLFSRKYLKDLSRMSTTAQVRGIYLMPGGQIPY